MNSPLKTVRRHGPIGLLTVALGSLLAYFYLENHYENVTSHDRLIRRIHDISYLDALALREVVSLSNRQAFNFDTLTKLDRHLVTAIKDLQNFTKNEEHIHNMGLADAAKNLLTDALHRRMLIERFKSTKAILANSLSRFPEILVQLNTLEKANKNDIETTKALESTQNLMFAFLTTLNPTLEQEALITTENLRRIAGRYGWEKRPSYQLIFQHIPLLVKTKTQENKLITAILAHDTTASINKVFDVYSRGFNNHLRQQQAVSQFLYLLSFVLILYSGYIMQKQRSLNRNLDQKVKQRTQELTKLNLALTAEVHERALIQKNLVDAQQQLVQSSKIVALGEMAGGIAHEINNPLGVIQLRANQMSRLLSTPSPDVEVLLKFSRIIESTSERITKIISGLRMFSRSGLDDPFVHYSLKTLIAESLAFCSERFKHHNIELRFDDTKPDVLINCRPVQISQVLVNLLNNAHDAIRSLESDKWIEVTWSALSGNRAEIRVTDSGQGIPQQLGDKIFQPFFTTKEVGSGTGLGLSVSLGIIKSHSGTLRIDYESKNTVFVIELPAVTEENLSHAA